jgi:hypothetical protein
MKTLCCAARCANLEPELALQITDTACAYLTDQLKARGYEVTVLDSAEIVKHKKMKKALKMDNNQGAGLYNGSTAHVSQEAAGGDGAILSTAATGVNHFWLGPAVKWQDGMDVLKKASKGRDAAMLAVSAFVDFTEPKSGDEVGGVARRSDYVGVTAAPAIRLFNDARWGAPNAGYGGGLVTFMHGDLEKNMMTVIDRDASWVVTQNDEEAGEWFTVRTLTIEPQKFRQAADGVLKVFVDELIAKYEESFYGDS